jgi:hypothetical protein
MPARLHVSLPKKGYHIWYHFFLPGLGEADPQRSCQEMVSIGFQWLNPWISMGFHCQIRSSCFSLAVLFLPSLRSA